MKTLSKLMILGLLVLASFSVYADGTDSAATLCGEERNTDGGEGSGSAGDAEENSATSE